MGLIGASAILTNADLEMNLITVRIVKSAAFECDWAGVVEETNSLASAVGGSSREPVFNPPPGKERSGSRSSGRPLDATRALPKGAASPLRLNQRIEL